MKSKVTLLDKKITFAKKKNQFTVARYKVEIMRRKSHNYKNMKLQVQDIKYCCEIKSLILQKNKGASVKYSVTL